LHCDAGKIRQILSNYVANALKYGEPPEARVHVSVLPSTSGHADVTLTVTSKGATLSPEEMATLFTALTRGRRARETNAHGMGLGLAICKKLAEAMGGTVGVESREGKTSFWFKARYANVAALPRAEPVNQTDFAGRRALVIEDEPYNRLVLDHHLIKLGFSVVWAEDGAGALAMLMNEPVDVIMMDWVLPDMDGGELVRQMKSSRNGALPPIIVVSAYSVAAKRAECLAAGAAEFISKPIDSKKLVAALERSQDVAV
jgi:CheY-like chemotaxis protein